MIMGRGVNMLNTSTEISAHPFHLCCLHSILPAVLMEDIVEAELPDIPATASQENPLQVS